MKLHAPWIASALIMAVLAVAVSVIFRDSLSRTAVKSDMATDVRTVNDRADTSIGEIVVGVSVSQSFEATEPNLARIEVLLATYQRSNTAPLLLSLREYPSNGALPLRTVEVEPDTIRDNSYHAFRFAPIADSSGKAYLLTLESPGAESGNAFTALIGNCDCYPDGALFLQGEQQPQLDLAFQTGYQNRQVPSVAGELVDRMSQYKPWFFKGAALPVFGLLALSLILLTVGSFFSSLFSGRQPRPSWAWLPIACLSMVTLILVLIFDPAA